MMHPIVEKDLRRDLRRLANNIPGTEQGMKRIEDWLHREERIAARPAGDPQERDRAEQASVAVTVLQSVIERRAR
jgi:hypothetical protein